EEEGPKLGWPPRKTLTAVGLRATKVVDGKEETVEQKEGRYPRLRVSVSGGDKVPGDKLLAVVTAAKDRFHKEPQPERLERSDAQLAGSTREKAAYAIIASWAAILLFLWFRFGSWTFGLAAVVCLIHDLFFTIGAIAACHYMHGTWFGNLLGVG